MKQVTLPQSFTVDVKDMGLVVIETGKWSDQFVKDVVKAFLKLKLEQQRYGDKTDREKAEAVEAKRRELEAGIPPWLMVPVGLLGLFALAMLLPFVVGHHANNSERTQTNHSHLQFGHLVS